MARVAFGCTLGQSLGSGTYNTRAGGRSSIVTLTNTASGTLTTDVAAAVAVLVADGASPTQGHVDTLNTAWGLLATAIAAADAAGGAVNVILDIDTTAVATQNAVRAALRELMLAVQGSGLATG